MKTMCGRFVRKGGFHVVLLMTAALILVVGCEKTTPDITGSGIQSGGPTAITGNGAPSGAHYNLNIIGVPKEKSADATWSSGHRIFVPLSGTTKIMLVQGEFYVIDANGTDGTAMFQLPNPDPDNDGVTAYSVYARALGKPGGSSVTTACATDSLDSTYCSLNSMVLVRSKGGSSFTNVSRDLLYIYADIDGDGTVDRVPLFDSRLQDYYWSYDNNKLKVAQLRFYEISTVVP